MTRLTLLLLVACGPKSAEPPPPVSPPDAGGEAVPADAPITPVQLHMSEHLERARAARDAVVGGRMDEARTELKWLAEHPTEPGVPEQWGSHIGAMREAAARGAAASESAELGDALADLANACGACHQAVGATVVLPAPAPPPDGPSVKEHMARHAWALDRMWASLVIGSGAHWAEAVEVLDSEPLDEGDFGERQPSLAAQAHATTVHDKTRAASGDDNPDTRADLYGQVVGACVGCHLEMR